MTDNTNDRSTATPTGVRIGRPTTRRFRVRTLLLLVALVAFGIEGTRVVRRWSLCRHRGSISAVWATSYRESATMYDDQARIFAEQAGRYSDREVVANLRRQEGVYRDLAAESRAFAAWSDAVAVLYEAGRARPWRPVPPEPPHPTMKVPQLRSFGWD